MTHQPKAVWAVAFASVVAFMGIGLVDPILKPIADNLNASPSQVSLLFTSYMAVMGVAMLITGVVASRIGPKKTLLLGLVVIIAGYIIRREVDETPAFAEEEAQGGVPRAPIPEAFRLSWDDMIRVDGDFRYPLSAIELHRGIGP